MPSIYKFYFYIGKPMLECNSQKLRKLYDLLESGREKEAREICIRSPELWNIVAYEAEWKKHPKAMDFLDPSSGNYMLKRFEKELYMEAMRPYLDGIKKGSLVLDTGGGIGRFAIEFARGGHTVHLVDASRTALKKAEEHLKDGRIDKKVKLYWADASDLSMFPDGYFDTTLAMELVCYCKNPERVTNELVRVTKKGGLLFISVEGKYGSMIADENVRIDDFQNAKKGKLCIESNMYVHYFTKETLAELMHRCGIAVLEVTGTHYVADGIFSRWMDERKLGSRDYRNKILDIERACMGDGILENLARAWVGIGRKR